MQSSASTVSDRSTHLHSVRNQDYSQRPAYNSQRYGLGPGDSQRYGQGWCFNLRRCQTLSLFPCIDTDTGAVLLEAHTYDYLACSGIFVQLRGG